MEKAGYNILCRIRCNFIYLQEYIAVQSQWLICDEGKIHFGGALSFALYTLIFLSNEYTLLL